MPFSGEGREIARLCGVALALVLAVAGCTSRGAVLTPSVVCKLLDQNNVRSYGSTFATNPFLAPSALFRGTPDEFVVVEVDLALPDRRRVDIAGSVVDSSRATVAPLYDLRQMHDYWARWGDMGNRDAWTRGATLEQYYPPSLEFEAHGGRSVYVIVLIGKRPLPRPADVVVSVSLGGAEPQLFTFTLPAAS